MLKITGVVDDKYTVLDTDDGSVENVSPVFLYQCMSIGVHIAGCHFEATGLVIEIDGHIVPRNSVKIEEVWKPVLNPDIRFQNGQSKYEVSNLGRLRVAARPSFSTGVYGYSGKVIPPKLKSISAGVVSLDDNKRTKSIAISRLVASAFVHNVSGGAQVDFLDGDSSNSRADNLVWVHKRKTGYTLKPVVQYSLEFEKIAEFESIARASEVTGVGADFISMCCKKSSTCRTAGGYIWRFADDADPCSELNDKPTVGLNVVEIRQYTLDGKLFAVHKSVKAAVLTSGVDSTSLMKCCNREYNQAGGYIWRRSFSDEFAKQNGLEETSPITVRQYTLDGEFIAEFRTATMAGKVVGAAGTNIAKCCRRAPCYSRVAGYLWRYSVDDEFGSNEYNAKAIKCFRAAVQTRITPIEKKQRKDRPSKQVRQYTLDGVFVAEYRSVGAAAEAFGHSYSSIYACCTGKTGSFKDYIWRQSSADEYENIGDNARLLLEFREKSSRGAENAESNRGS